MINLLVLGKVHRCRAASFPGLHSLVPRLLSAGEEPGNETRSLCICRLQYETMHKFCTASNEPVRVQELRQSIIHVLRAHKKRAA